MMYPYITLAGESVIVHFERPTEGGFDSAEYRLPNLFTVGRYKAYPWSNGLLENSFI